MKFTDLRDRVVTIGMTTIVDQDCEYLAVTPVIKQPGTMPYRIVLIHDFDSDKLAVFTQYFNKYDWASNYLTVSSPSFSTGNYFGPDQLHLALQKFGERVAAHAGNFIESIYRDDAKHAV